MSPTTPRTEPAASVVPSLGDLRGVLGDNLWGMVVEQGASVDAVTPVSTFPSPVRSRASADGTTEMLTIPANNRWPTMVTCMTALKDTFVTIENVGRLEPRTWDEVVPAEHVRCDVASQRMLVDAGLWVEEF